MLNWESYLSPLGWISVCEENRLITKVVFGKSKIESPSIVTGKCIKQLDEYFFGLRKEFTLKLKLSGTPLQQEVFQALLKIPYGKYCSYEEIAKNIKRDKAVRFVGTACHNNPIAIIVPCHRVVRKNGGVGQYAYGDANKLELLNMEKMNVLK